MRRIGIGARAMAYTVAALFVLGGLGIATDGQGSEGLAFVVAGVGLVLALHTWGNWELARPPVEVFNYTLHARCAVEVSARSEEEATRKLREAIEGDSLPRGVKLGKVNLVQESKTDQENKKV